MRARAVLHPTMRRSRRNRRRRRQRRRKRSRRERSRSPRCRTLTSTTMSSTTSSSESEPLTTTTTTTDDILESDGYTRRVLSAADRVLFVDKLHPRFYYALLRESRAVLDTYLRGLHYHHGRMSVGTPVVTLRHQTLARGRATAAVLRALAKKSSLRRPKGSAPQAKAAARLSWRRWRPGGSRARRRAGLEWDLVADDKDGFVKKAAALSFDPFRAQLSCSSRIPSRPSSAPLPPCPSCPPPLSLALGPLVPLLLLRAETSGA